MERGFHRVCSSCQHVEIHHNRDDFGDVCPQCGARASGQRRAFVEPVGFLTSYEDRVGRDPGASRLRVKPVDEARLLTRPRPEDFEQSDLSGVTSFFAPAITPEGKLAGQMLILNRGPQGAGYLWCPICEHARPAPTEAIGGAEIRAIHNNPRTGDRCRVEALKWPVDLAHVFETDLRGIRIALPMPLFSDLTESERRAAHDGFVRTLAESVRREQQRRSREEGLGGPRSQRHRPGWGWRKIRWAAAPFRGVAPLDPLACEACGDAFA